MALEDANALALIRLSKDLQTEPHRFAGFYTICDWLENEKQPSGFKVMVRELELKFHNQKIFPRQHGLLGLQRNIMGGGK